MWFLYQLEMYSFNYWFHGNIRSQHHVLVVISLSSEVNYIPTNGVYYDIPEELEWF